MPSGYDQMAERGLWHPCYIIVCVSRLGIRREGGGALLFPRTFEGDDALISQRMYIRDPMLWTDDEVCINS